LGAAAGLADIGEAPPVHQLTYSRPADPLAGVGCRGFNNNTDHDDGSTAAGEDTSSKRTKTKKTYGGASASAGAGAGQGPEAFEEEQRRANDAPWKPPEKLPPRQGLTEVLTFELAEHVILIMSTHRSSLSMQLKGLLVLRLLLREPLVKRAMLSNLMEVDEWDKVEVENEGRDIDDEYAREAASVG
jgi:hypothetical protein